MFAMQQPTPSTPAIPFAWAWWGFDLGDARPCDGTYCHYPIETLPPIPTLDGTLSWLGQPGWPEAPGDSPRQRALRERDSAEARDKAQDLATQAERLGLRLPDAFMRLMAAPELQDRIPECTGCWFSLYEAPLVPCSGSEDGFVVRFLNDQQGCILWYLYLTRQGAEAVLAVGDPYPDAPSPYLERLVRPDEDGPLTDEQRHAVLANTYACAPSFEAFLYRWWLESTIAMKLDGFDSEPLTEQERRYLTHSQQAWWPQ
jgi:hypothetical protein